MSTWLKWRRAQPSGSSLWSTCSFIGLVVIKFRILGSSAIATQWEVPIYGWRSMYRFSLLPLRVPGSLSRAGAHVVLSILATFFTYATRAESMTYTMASMTARGKHATESGEHRSLNGLKIFWGVSIAMFEFTFFSPESLRRCKALRLSGNSSPRKSLRAV